MAKKTLVKHSDHFGATIKGFDGSYLADVLRPWDCYAQEWADRYMRILRFEEDDLFVWMQTGSIYAERGAIDTEAFDCGSKIAFDAKSVEDMCVCWRRDPAYGEACGYIERASKLLGEFI